ncbi:unnamed protein product [Durusdinium trenchii]|uniref:ABC transmembrane type-1 domain-containing protein n=2 Tax=Durusdinium trenchii TaxID=1381693 RepID=A0ABP0H6M0_9DINO
MWLMGATTCCQCKKCVGKLHEFSTCPDSDADYDSQSEQDSDADYDSQSEQGLDTFHARSTCPDSDVDDKLVSIWQRLERNGLLGPGTRRWFQHFCFALPGRLCAFATISACIYCLVRPNEQIVALLGKKAFNLAGAMCAIATLCGISSAYGATHILHDTSFRKLVTRVKSSQAPAFTADDDQFNEKDSDWRGRRFDFDWLPMLNLIARLLGYALLIGIPLCPAFESDPMYLLAWLLAVVFLVFFCPGCFYIQTLVVKLSHHHVKGLIEDIEHAAKRKAPGKPAQFWQEMTEKHKKMDRTLETIWDLAMWMVLPHFISSVAFGTIGLVACLTGLATRSDSLALAGLPILLIMLFEVTNRLDEMASITKMCMSTATKTPMTSILASAIAASGKSPWKNDAGCKSVGYNDLADERADHARFFAVLENQSCRGGGARGVD